ncbi:ABC transporter permease [Microbacterium sp. RD1]|uniref:ABC transporter permease n=1 Tax=Microbacterium sp. RD1 TaxID=3457313 RepID=UPI003FA57E20
MNTSVAQKARDDREARGRAGSRTMQLLEQLGLPLLMLIMILLFSLNPLTGPVFTSSANINNILANQAVTALVALAMVVPLTGNYFDLSVGAVTGVSNIVVAAAIGPYGLPVWVGILLGLGAGAVIGFINGFLVAGLRLNGFVVTLGTYTALLGLIIWYTNGQLITQGIPREFGQWSSESWLGIPRPFYILIVVGLVVWYFLTQIPFGRRLEAIGINENAARLVGINTRRTIWISFVISATLAAAAGALQTSRGGAGDPTIGTAFLFPALAAVFLGATTIRPGKYNVWGTIIGVFFVAISVSGFTLLGADVWVQPVFNGISLVVAVMLSTLIARRRDLSAARAAEGAIVAPPRTGKDAEQRSEPDAAGERGMSIR